MVKVRDGGKLVGAGRFELPTLCSQSRCATRLRHAPARVGSFAAAEASRIVSDHMRECRPLKGLERFAMTAQLIDGRKLAAEVKNQVRGQIEAALARGGRRPALAVVKVGSDPASEVYVRNKRK